MQRFHAFCRQEALNPKSRLFAVITDSRDMYRLQGHLEFDVVFLTDWKWIKNVNQVWAEIQYRAATPGYAGTFYFLKT